MPFAAPASRGAGVPPASRCTLSTCPRPARASPAATTLPACAPATAAPSAAPPSNAPSARRLLVLPGGSGSEEFAPFIGNIYRQSIPAGYLPAQLVAPQWSPDQAEQVVWPTAGLPSKDAKFVTEDFIASVVQDIAARYKLDSRHTYATGWSSSGLHLYASLYRPDSPLTGAFVAMSVFKPEQIADLKGAAGRSVYILHSPEDFIQMRFPEAARDQLAAAGARTTWPPTTAATAGTAMSSPTSARVSSGSRRRVNSTNGVFGQRGQNRLPRRLTPPPTPKCGKARHVLAHPRTCLKAGDKGFEPLLTDPESVVLPLHQSPNGRPILPGISTETRPSPEPKPRLPG
jgi:predicted esterase